MPPKSRLIWRPRLRSVPVQSHDLDVNTNTNTNIHVHILPRASTPKFDNSSIPTSLSTPSPSPSPSPSTTPIPGDSTPAQTSSLWSSTYNSGTGAIIAGIIDSGLVLILIVFLGVVFMQWKKRTGSVPSTPPPPKNNPRTDRDQTQEQDASGLVQVDSHGNYYKEKTGTPTLVAGSGSGSEEEHDNENMRRLV